MVFLVGQLDRGDVQGFRGSRLVKDGLQNLGLGEFSGDPLTHIRQPDQRGLLGTGADFNQGGVINRALTPGEGKLDQGADKAGIQPFHSRLAVELDS